MTGDILQVNELEYGYERGRAVLKSVNLSFARGTLTGVLGPNGSGKTTLIKLLTGALKPDKGCVLLNGRDVLKYQARELARSMSIVPQSTQIDFDMTALDVALMGRQPYMRRFERESEEDIRIAREALERADVLRYQDTPVTALSGGELQRVIIARALTQQADVMLLDEPVSNLDIRHTARMLALVRDLVRERGVCAVCVLHDLSLAGWFCDRIALMHAGKVYACGAPIDVLTQANVRDVYGVDADIVQDGTHVRVLPRYE